MLPSHGSDYLHDYDWMDGMQMDETYPVMNEVLPDEARMIVETALRELDVSYDQVARTTNYFVSHNILVSSLDPSPLLLARNYVGLFKNTVETWSSTLEFENPTIMNNMMSITPVPSPTEFSYESYETYSDSMETMAEQNPPDSVERHKKRKRTKSSSNSKQKKKSPRNEDIGSSGNTGEEEFITLDLGRTSALTWEYNVNSNDSSKSLTTPVSSNAKKTTLEDIQEDAPLKITQKMEGKKGGKVKHFTVISPKTLAQKLNKEKPPPQPVTPVIELIARIPPRLPARLSDFELLDTIIVASFSHTRLSRYKETGKLYSIKIMNRKTLYKHSQIEHADNEKNLSLFITHPGITTFFTTFSNEESLFIVQEFVPGGDLFTQIRKFGRLDVRIAKFYAGEVILVIEHLHRHGVAYRDLKPENILLDLNGHIKLTEFTFAKAINNQKAWTVCGTPEYIAPEVMAGTGHGLAVDWWSLGVLIFEMLAGHPPFVAANPVDLFNLTHRPEDIVFPSFFEPEVKDLIQRFIHLIAS
eukprot:TRINITY_DN3248_c0_g1_i2.p1 TRINITY_DN3248_c0_g1~~TRINITY_DN3248_c0_g1_i2.p1  ORF type:complete len:528 (-),score=82.08 TRINITY_DN3248_c0_g1_i2:442-2025(-)